MTREELHRLASLARRLETTPRQVLIGAAQMANSDDSDAREFLHRLRQIGMRNSALAADCCNLLLTPVASYAKASLAGALDVIWQGTPQARR